MVDIVDLTNTVHQTDDIVHSGHDIWRSDGPLLNIWRIGNDFHLLPVNSGDIDMGYIRTVQLFQNVPGNFDPRLHHDLSATPVHHVLGQALAQNPLSQTKLLVNLVPAHRGQIITFGLIE